MRIGDEPRSRHEVDARARAARQRLEAAARRAPAGRKQREIAEFLRALARLVSSAEDDKDPPWPRDGTGAPCLAAGAPGFAPWNEVRPP
jgi:hypothetical protein